MPTGSNIVTPLANVSTPTTGNTQQAVVTFGGSAILQACTNLFLDIQINDPTNTGAPANFSAQVRAGIGDAVNPIGELLTQSGLVTVNSTNPFTHWAIDLVTLTGGVAPAVTIRGVAGS